MAGSQEHTGLVMTITDWVRERYGSVLRNVYVLADLPTTLPGDRPSRIGAFVPDVVAGTVPETFTLVGEAKCPDDLRSPRSLVQIKAFIRFLALEPSPVFVLATRRYDSPTARRIVRGLKQDLGAQHVESVFLSD